MMKMHKLNQKGLTLIELIVVMLVMSILAIMMANFIANWLQSETNTQKRADLLTNAQNALDTITEDIRMSGSVDANNRWPDANGPSGNQFGWASGSQTLILAKTAVTSGNTVIFSDPSNYITQKDNAIYYLSGTTLYRRILESTDASDAATTTCPPSAATSSCPADKTIATGVKTFTVTYYDADNNVVTPANARSVQLAITLTTKQNTQTISASYSTRMVFRND